MVKKRDVGVGDVQERIVFCQIVCDCSIVFWDEAVGVGKFGKTARYFCRDEEFLSRNVCCVVLDSVCDLLVDGVRVGECCVETTATNAEEFTVVQVVVAVCGSTS